MSKKDILLTSEGFLELEEELNNLKNVRRPKVIEAIKDARAQGDLSDSRFRFNSNYFLCR